MASLGHPIYVAILPSLIPVLTNTVVTGKIPGSIRILIGNILSKAYGKEMAARYVEKVSISGDWEGINLLMFVTMGGSDETQEIYLHTTTFK